MEAPEAFKRLIGADDQPDEHWDGPVYVLWVFDPMTDQVIIDHNKGRNRALTKTHADIAPEVIHPSRLNGYAYRIRGGWRLTSDDHKEVSDPHVVRRVDQALKKKFPPKPLVKLNA